MIKKLKLKLVFLTMASLFVLLATLVSGMNIINYNTITNEADKILEILSHNQGAFPENKNNKTDKYKKHMSPEAPYESRYFTVLLDDSGNVIQTNTSRIKSVNTKQAIEYSQKVKSRNSTNGFIDIYRYIISNESDGVRIIFLDCRKQLDSFYSFLYASIFMSVIGYLIVFAIIFFCSGKIIRPIAESYEKQKRFITDAGHEIKTPLTIINANADILEAEFSSNESIEDIRLQTKRLTQLTNELVYLAKMEEAAYRNEQIELPLSEVVSETSNCFRALFQNNNISFYTNIESLLTIKGNVKDIEQLVSVLLDNALKYTNENGEVKLSLTKRNKNVELSIFNTTKVYIEKDSVNKVFDRFYRSDLSRNSETGGYGIGLSIAKAIVNRHSGKIHAETLNGYDFKITAILPM